MGKLHLVLDATCNLKDGQPLTQVKIATVRLNALVPYDRKLARHFYHHHQH